MKLRYQGFRETLDQAGIPFKDSYVIEGKQGRISAREMAKALLSLETPPTAIFASSDTHGIGILDAANEMGVKVPEDLSVIGYDNIRDSAYNDLSTIDQNLFDSGVMGAQMLLDLLGNQANQPCKQFVSLELVKRNTTSSPPI
jgi:DNA-binding LacI/PurR family transcriptional regulator